MAEEKETDRIRGRATQEGKPPAGAPPLRVLVVDDEPEICRFLVDALSRLGHQATVCRSGEEAFAEACRQVFDAVLLDVNMPGISGVEALKRVRQLLPGAALVMITGKMDSQLVGEALGQGASLCLSKPLQISMLEDLLQGIAEAKDKLEKVRLAYGRGR